jgi:Concanavalin A-like lectin/glucanases superfamily
MAHTDNNVGFWDLDSDANDDSGNGNNGTASGASFDGKATFNSTTDYITIPDASGLKINTTFTLAFWANLLSTSVYGWIISKFDSGADVGRGVRTEGGSVLCATEQNANFLVPTYTSGLRHHCIISSGGGSTYYIDGSSSATGSSLTHWFNSDGELRFGSPTSAQFNSSNGSIGGTLQSVAFYTDAKDGTWLTADYNGGTPKKWADWAGSPAANGNMFLVF